MLSASFLYSMNKRINDFETLVQDKTKQNTLPNRDPFNIINENSKDGSVILNHTFKNENLGHTGESIISNNKWLYQTSPKYNQGVIDLNKIEKSEESRYNTNDIKIANGNKSMKDKILESIKSIHSRIDSIHSALSVNPDENNN